MATEPQTEPQPPPSPNGPPRPTLNLNDPKHREIVANILLSRDQFLQRYMDPRRDIDKECGYPSSLSPEDYKAIYDFDPIGNRVVSVMPAEVWKNPPTVYESEDADTVTPFEAAWDDVSRTLRGRSWHRGEAGGSVWSLMHRGDRLRGVASYAVILVGIDDGKPLDQPAEMLPLDGSGGRDVTRKITFARVFDQTAARVTKLEEDTKNPRYGQPVEYELTFSDPASGEASLGTTNQKVHWSRIVHLPSNRDSSEVFAISRLRPVFKRVLDLAKLYGGSAEMYWRGAFPGLSIETHPSLGGDVVVDDVSTRREIEPMMNGLQRYMRLTGMTAKSLAPQVVDPTPQIDVQLNAICIQIGVPKRVFMGSEVGERSSEEDSDRWNDRLQGYEDNEATPVVVCPVVDRFIELGVLPVPEEGYVVEWPNLHEMKPLEKADVASKRTQAMATYVGGSVENLMSPLDFLTREMGFSEEEATAIIDATMQAIDSEEQMTIAPEPEVVEVPGQDGGDGFPVDDKSGA